MICPVISNIIGFTCHPLSDDGSVAMIDTPFAFPDGEEIPVFVETVADQVRFFDDGGANLHLMGRGISVDDQRRVRFLKNLAEPNGVSLNSLGELEIWTKPADAPRAFAKYMATMLALASWELDQNGVLTDTSLLLDEVTACLRAWKSAAALSEGREYVGVSGQVYKMDLHFDDCPVLAIGTHSAAVSAAAKKLLDIRGATENNDLKVLIVIDDRHDAEKARREGRVLDSVGSVMMMTGLEQSARIGQKAN